MSTAGVWAAYEDIGELLFHPDALDVTKQRFDRFFWAIPEGYTDLNGKTGATGLRWQLQVTEVIPVAYNSQTVSQETLDSIQSYRDFLRPEIVERTVMDNIFIAASTGRRVRMWRVMGPEFMEELFTAYHEGGNLLQEGERRLVDGMAQGKWDLAITASGSVDDVIDAGIPWAFLVPDERTLEGGLLPDIGGGGARIEGTIVKAPHPNATKLWHNWLFTQEGQTAMQTLYEDDDYNRPSLRNDIPQGKIVERVWSRTGMSKGFEMGEPLEPGLAYQEDLQASLEFGQQLMERLGIAF
jgi:ABC-type Fe3+ transport system substrate-binding protein